MADHDLQTMILVTWSAIRSRVTHCDWLSEVMWLTKICGKASATAKLDSQLTMVAMVTAMGLASWRKSSATISHGIAPVQKMWWVCIYVCVFCMHLCVSVIVFECVCVCECVICGSGQCKVRSTYIGLWIDISYLGQGRREPWCPGCWRPRGLPGQWPGCGNTGQ